MTIIPVSSSQIHGIGHDPLTNTLAIQFPRREKGEVLPGWIYHYSNFDAAKFAEFQAAESKGIFFGKHIKGNEAHPFQKLPAKEKAAE